MLKEIKCQWCGETFTRKYAPEKYCSDECRRDARKLQNRNKSFKWYHKNKNDLTEKQRYGLGGGNLGQHRQKDFKKEYTIIRNELRRLKIK